jgi:phosphopantetheinyl transferase (holo-ACP synthase)
MVGNDVVDLGDAETCNGPAHPRFDARVFAPSEQAALAASDAANRLRWSLWAAKEAAYKLAVKQSPGLVFSPRRFVVSLRSDLPDEVSTPVGIFDVALASKGDALHAVAKARGAPTPAIGLTNAGSEVDASKAVRRFAARCLAERLAVTPGDLHFGRRGRVPTLQLRGDSRRFDLSLSHHGRYLAFACAIDGSAQ